MIPPATASRSALPTTTVLETLVEELLDCAEDCTVPDEFADD